MKKSTTLTAAVLLITAFSAPAQRVEEAVTFIEEPAGLHFVFETVASRPGKGVFTYANTNNGDREVVNVDIANNGSFQGTSNGRTVTGQIRSTTITMTFAGASRTGEREPAFGPTGRFAGRFYGSYRDPAVGVGALSASISVNGKFLLNTYLGNGENIGVGRIDGNGDYSIRLLNGVQAFGNFGPRDGLAGGAFILSNGVALPYILAKSVPAKLANISTRGRVTNDGETLIGGLIIDEGLKGVLIVARGPSLGGEGVPNPVQNPKVELYLRDQLVASNNNWKENANAAEIAASGAAPSDDREAALQLTLAPNAYTVVVSSESGVPGTGLVEIFGVGGPLGR
ncbi:MAG: hypothetical protein H0W20_14875 [Chthoniobacterales bacterium]|nr:hypothetical protein [Chthoniobacterales bacterium]